MKPPNVSARGEFSHRPFWSLVLIELMILPGYNYSFLIVQVPERLGVILPICIFMFSNENYNFKKMETRRLFLSARHEQEKENQQIFN